MQLLETIIYNLFNYTGLWGFPKTIDLVNNYFSELHFDNSYKLKPNYTLTLVNNAVSKNKFISISLENKSPNNYYFNNSGIGESVSSWYVGGNRDYYPFGMPMPGRTFSSNQYRYGFGGQEKDDEISGEGNSYTAEYWQYDSRLGRRWNVDPVDKLWMTSYHAFSNNPILNIDPNGAEDNPVYDKETNEFLGTDENGWSGEAILMDKDDFVQDMSHDKALEKGTLFSKLDNHDRFVAMPVDEHYNSVMAEFQTAYVKAKEVQESKRKYDENMKAVRYTVKTVGQVVSYAGTAIEVVGYGTLIFGGAGAPIILVGKYVSTGGAVIEASIDAIDGNWTNASIVLISETVGWGGSRLIKNEILKEGVQLKIKLGTEMTKQVIEHK